MALDSEGDGPGAVLSQSRVLTYAMIMDHIVNERPLGPIKIPQ